MTVRRCERGFTVLEVMIAALVLAIGVQALVGSSALVTRQVGRGRILTVANELARRKLDSLRVIAATADGTGRRCTDAGFASGGPATERSVTHSWTVTSSGTSAREVRVTAAYPVPGGRSSLTLSTLILCR